jgi:hypothetical protein
VGSQALPRDVMLCALSVFATFRSHPLVASEAAGPVADAGDPAAQLVARLDLERYKATIRSPLGQPCETCVFATGIADER